MFEAVLKRILEASRSYRELMSQQYKNWMESMYITATEFGGNFGTTYQTLNKIYPPLTKVGARTIALVSALGFTGKTSTLIEIEIDGAGDPPAATFKWRKQTLLGGTFGAWTEGVLTGADITVIDGIHVNFNDTGYVIGDKWHIQGCGSWHTPEDGVDSYLTSLFIYPFDTAKDPKAGFFRVLCCDYRILEYITSRGEFPNWRTPIHMKGDGAGQFRIELAEITGGDIEYMFCVMKGWDE
ncbi:hypothetical protein ES708_15469 [subsurface metagenome]